MAEHGKFDQRITPFFYQPCKTFPLAPEHQCQRYFKILFCVHPICGGIKSDYPQARFLQGLYG